MKFIIIILICLSSCKGPEVITQEVIKPTPERIDQPQVIIYPPPESDKVMTSETFRMLVLEISGLISTIIAVWTVTDNQ